MTGGASDRVRYLIEKSCEHGYFGKHVIDRDPAGDTYCLTKPVVLHTSEELVERIAMLRCHYESACEVHRIEALDILAALATTDTA